MSQCTLFSLSLTVVRIVNPVSPNFSIMVLYCVYILCGFLCVCVCVLQKKNMKRIPSVKNKDVIHRQTSEAESECMLNCYKLLDNSNNDKLSALKGKLLFYILFDSVWSPDSSPSLRTAQQAGTGKENINNLK